MSDYIYLALAKHQLDERIEQARHSGLPARRRRRFRRHVVASTLHNLANRIDG